MFRISSFPGVWHGSCYLIGYADDVLTSAMDETAQRSATLLYEGNIMFKRKAAETQAKSKRAPRA